MATIMISGAASKTKRCIKRKSYYRDGIRKDTEWKRGSLILETLL